MSRDDDVTIVKREMEEMKAKYVSMIESLNEKLESYASRQALLDVQLTTLKAVQQNASRDAEALEKAKGQIIRQQIIIDRQYVHTPKDE
jgi:hypothetical protein